MQGRKSAESDNMSKLDWKKSQAVFRYFPIYDLFEGHVELQFSEPNLDLQLPRRCGAEEQRGIGRPQDAEHRGR